MDCRLGGRPLELPNAVGDALVPLEREVGIGLPGQLAQTEIDCIMVAIKPLEINVADCASETEFSRKLATAIAQRTAGWGGTAIRAGKEFPGRWK